MPESTACDRKRKQAIHSGFAVFDKPAVRIGVYPKGGECHDNLRAALRRTLSGRCVRAVGELKV